MNKFKKFLIIFTASVFMLSVIPNDNQIQTVEAHSGRTDASGGHRDNKNKSGLGPYHYHCGGYPAHLHTNGVCPYDSASAETESSSAAAYTPASSYVGQYKYASDEYARRLINGEFHPDIVAMMPQDANTALQVLSQEELTYLMNAADQQDADDIAKLAYIRVYDLLAAQVNNNQTQSQPGIANTYDSIIFSADYYAGKYPELVTALGNSPEILYQHFIQSGMAEGRQGAATFNVQVYINNNPDLVQIFGNNLPAYYEHYLNAGQYEGRTAY